MISQRLLTDFFSSSFWIILASFRLQRFGGYIYCRYYPQTFESKIGFKEPKNRLKLNPLTVSNTEESTRAFGAQLAQTLKPGDILALHGDLGAGKTTFVKGLISMLCEETPENIQSPTFTYLHIYEGEVPVYHFDLYRLKKPQDFVELGFLDYFDGVGICAIEWSEKIASLLPTHTLHVEFTHVDEGKRGIRTQYVRED